MRALFRHRRGRHGAAVLLVAVVVGVAALLSPIGSASSQAVPSNTVKPAVTGTAAVGQTLTTSDGTWTESPTSFTYQWVRCAASGGQPDGSDCAVIGGATTKGYVVASGDVGFRLRSRVTAVNGDGQATVASDATAVVVAQAGPPNTQAPAITGTATVGSTLTANPGTWTGTSVTFTYQWRRCDTSGNNCTAISGATGTTYVVATQDVGQTIRVAVTGTDPTGGNTVTSAQTATVTAAPVAPATGCPSDKSTTPINVSDVTSPAHLVIDKQQIRPQPVVRDTQTIELRFHVSACSGRSVVGALVYQTPTPYQQFSASEQPTGADGWATLTLHRLRHFPASAQQQLLIVFVRARKSGEDLLGGISARRLVSFKVSLKG
jgi:Ig domain of plant-specific actin-binding protein